MTSYPLYTQNKLNELLNEFDWPIAIHNLIFLETTVCSAWPKPENIISRTIGDVIKYD